MTWCCEDVRVSFPRNNATIRQATQSITVAEYVALQNVSRGCIGHLEKRGFLIENINMVMKGLT